MATHNLSTINLAAAFTRDHIDAQQQSLSKVGRFPFMRFEPQLEAAFEQFRYKRLQKRVPIICITGLVLFVVFSVLDFFSLPELVYQVSIPVRLFLICPLITLIMVLAAKDVKSSLFFVVYFSVYLIGGLSIIGIIYASTINNHYLPYDGILLHLVFGYFLMGLPYKLAIYGGLFVSGVYLFASVHMSLPLEHLASNSIFMVSVNFMGAIGCYIQERARRFLFLNEMLVALAKAKDKKEIASKTRLVATASHDLRQPLHAMNLLIEELEAQLPEGEQKGIVNSLNISIKQLSLLLNTLLDISKLNVGIVQPKLESMNLAEKIERFCQEQSLRTKAAGISLQYEGVGAALVKTDPVLFDRILRNVMENIFVHAQASNVHIFWRTEPDNVYLELRDNGKGIPEEDLKMIFDEFRQSGDYAGTGMGLGLTIVKQLAELLGIQYGLTSELNVGSCFWFKISLATLESKRSLPALEQVTIVKKHQSSYAQDWADKIESWGYMLTILPLGANMKAAHIRKVLPASNQVLVWDASEDENANHTLVQIRALQAAFDFELPILIVSDLEAKEYVLSEDECDAIEIVSPLVRPAKLRLIVEHLMSQI